MIGHGDESDDHFGSMPHLQRMICGGRECLFDDSRSLSPPSSTQCVRLVQLGSRELRQSANVGAGSRIKERTNPQATTTRRVFICQRNSGSGKSTASRSASRLDHNFDSSTVSMELRNKGEPLSPDILGGKAENGYSRSNAAIQIPRPHTVLVMLLDLSAVQDAAFQQMQSLANKNGLVRTNMEMIEFKHLSEFATISQFRRWFSRENEGTQAWHLISRQCFALKPIEVHIYMCNLNKGCPCLLAVRYSMLFDEIGVFEARKHVHKNQQEDEDDDIEVIWPPHIEKNQSHDATTSDGCKSSSIMTNTLSSHPTCSSSIREPLCEVANTDVDWAEDTFHSSASTDCEPSNCSSNSSHVGPAEDLLSKVLQEADIPVDFGLDIGDSCNITHDIHEGCAFEDNQGVIAQEEVVSSSNILVRRSIVMRDNKMKRMALMGQRMHETNASRSHFTIAGGAFSRCFENGRSTSLSTVTSENDRYARKRCTWKVVSRCSDDSLGRGTIKIRRVESIKAISDANVFRDKESRTAIQSSEGRTVSMPVYTLSVEQLEALRPKRKGESSRLEAKRDFQPAIEQQAIMADELMDCCDSEPFTAGSSIEQTAAQKSTESGEQQVGDRNIGSDQQSANVHDGTDPTLSSPHLTSPLKSDGLNIETIVEKLSQYMGSCLTTRKQKLCYKRVLEVLDNALTYKTIAIGHRCVEAKMDATSGRIL